MIEGFRTAIAHALPSAQSVQARLNHLTRQELLEVAEYFTVKLPDVDVLIALPGAEDLTRVLKALRGLPFVRATPGADGRDRLQGSALQTPGEIQPGRHGVQAALVSLDVTDGLPELRAMHLAAHQGWRVGAVAAAVIRTDAPGHVRLSLQGVPLLSPVVLADTPSGLVFERRFLPSA